MYLFTYPLIYRRNYLSFYVCVCISPYLIVYHYLCLPIYLFISLIYFYRSYYLSTDSCVYL